jgi:hypothetical protein
MQGKSCRQDVPKNQYQSNRNTSEVSKMKIEANRIWGKSAFHGRMTAVASVVLALFLAFFPTCALAQNASAGDIRGTVTDQTGAVVPGVKVTVLNTQTGVLNEFTTNNAGVYDTVSILSGVYTLTFSKKGFQTYVRSGIILEVGATTVNAVLHVGTTQQQVVVSGIGTLLKTDTGEQSTAITTNEILQLPDVGVSWTNYVQTLPGVSGGGTQFSVNGNMPYEDNFQLNGGSITYATSANVDPDVLETVAEVKIDTSNFSAEYGNGGAVLNAVTKSGTNQFHGAAYEYLQNDFFNAKTFFATSVPMERWNNWGGSIGGPILKNKMFFYFNGDRLHNNSQSYEIWTFPTDQIKAGNFSASTYPTIYNPYNVVNGVRQPFPGNVIPENMIDPLASNVQKYYPEPNMPGTFNNWDGALPDSNPSTKYTGRLDYNITDSNRLTTSVVEMDFPMFDGAPDNPMDVFSGDSATNQVQITDYWTINPSMVNQARMAFTRQAGYYIPLDYGLNFPQKLGWDYAKANLFPSIWINGSSGNGGVWIGAGTNAIYVQNIWQPSDVLTWVHGKHIFNFGGEFIANQVNNTQWGNLQAGNFNFTGNYTQIAPYSSGGIGYADFLLGQVQQWSATNSPMTGLRSKIPQFFAQDAWKLKPNLTLNYGLRYEHQTPWSEVQNRMGDFDPNIINPVTKTLGAIWFAGNDGRSTLEEPVNNFLPRIGFSYAPTDKWAIRGGYGLYTYQWSVDVYAQNANGFGSSSTGSMADYSQVAPIFIFSSSNPPLNYVQASRDPGAYNGHSVPYYPVHTPVAIIQEYSLSVQRDLGYSTVAEIAYVGSHGQDLSFPVDINQVPESQLAQQTPPYPQYQSINGDTFNAISNYNSLQLSLRKKYKNNLSFDVNYTWSKFMDDQDSSGWGSHGGPQNYQNAYDPSANYGLANYDITYNLKGDMVYQLPFGKGQKYLNNNGIIESFFGGWQMSAIANTQSGSPYTVYVGSANNSGAEGGAWYPNVVPGVSPHVSHPTINQWFNPAAFAIPAPFTFGNSRRNSLRGPGLSEVNLSVAKNFPFSGWHDPMNLQIRMDAFNAFNHTNLGNPNGGIGTPNASTITSTDTSGRVVQLGTRFSF